MVGYFDNEFVCGWYYFEDSYYGDGTKETAEMIALRREMRLDDEKIQCVHI